MKKKIAVLALVAAPLLMANTSCEAAPGSAGPGSGVVAGATAGNDVGQVPGSVAGAQTGAQIGAGASATRAQLLALPVKGKAPMTGYDRLDKYGPAWTDNVSVAGGGNGCDTRNDILARDLTNITKSGACTVTKGTLADPYTGKTIAFTRGKATSSAVQIDHVVALANSWVTGAQSWPQAKRVNFANDPRNLLAADGPANQAKGASDASGWVPKGPFRCQYATLQVQMKADYGLWVTQAEKQALLRYLATCR